MDVAESKNDVSIRLTEERWFHIVVIYRELNKEDGFVITAFLTRRRKQLERRRKIWQR
jgi:hypothetical protein